MIFIHHFLQLLFLFLSTHFLSAKTVNVFVQTNWNYQSLIAEVGEFINDINPSYYWDFFAYISECSSSNSTDLADFNCALIYCSQQIGFGYSHLLSFVQSLHYYSPKIQMYRQIAEEYTPYRLILESQYCQAFVVLCDDIIVCDIHQISTYLPLNSDKCNTDTLNIGHTSKVSPYICQNISNSIIVVVYGPFGKQLTIDIFDKILSLCEIGLLGGFIYRPWYLSGDVHYPILLSGYGVELAIKSTEYHTVDDISEDFEHHIDLSQNRKLSSVDGLNFELLSSLHVEYIEELHSFQNQLIETYYDLLPLKQWQISELGLQLCQWLITRFPKMGLNALDSLVKFVQYFPVESKHLYFLDVTDELRKEIIFNQRVLNNFGIESGQNILSFNGKIFQNFDPFTMIPFLFDELSMLTKFQTLGVSPVDIITLIQLDFSNEEIDYGIDTRHQCVHYLNDIESDIEYSSWTTSLHDLLRPTFPGVVRQVRRNLFNLILCLDPTKIESYYLLKSAEYFLRHRIPVRIGLIIFPSDRLDFYKNDVALSISCFYSYLYINRSNKFAFKWLLDLCSYIFSTNKTLSLQEVSAHFQSYTGESFSNHTNCTYFSNLSFEFFLSKGLTHFQSIFLNGIPLIINYVNIVSQHDFIIENIVSSINERIFSQTRILQKDIYFDILLEEMNVYDYIMTKSNIVSRLNYRILSKNWRKIDLFCYNTIQHSWFNEVVALSPCEVSQVFAKSTPYILNPIYMSQIQSLSLWLVADFASLNGLKFLMNSLDMLVSSSTVRIGLIFNDPPSLEFNLNKLFISLIFTQTDDVLLSFLSGFRNITDTSKFTLEISLEHLSKHENFNEDEFLNFALSNALNIVALNYYFFATEILKIPTKMSAIIVNGHILETLWGNESFDVEDFIFLERFSYNHHGKIMHSILNEIDLNRNISQQNLFRNFTLSTFKSDILLYLTTILLGKQKIHRIQLPHYELRSKYSLIYIQPRISNKYYSNLDIILDPLSKEAQRLLPISSELYNAFNIQLRIWLCPPERISVLPINRFYTYVISSVPYFEKNGSLSLQHPQARFTDLPKSPLLSLILDIPHVWVVEPIISDYDLDNLPRDSESNNILAVFSLSHILLEGNCLDHSTHEPVPGLQFSLGTTYEPKKFDSLVMENLGYFQLKFFPGLWELRMNDESNQQYYISKQEGGNFLSLGDTILLYCDNFIGVNLQILVTKYAFKKHPISYNECGNDIANGHGSTLNSIWKSITNLLPNVQTTGATSNILGSHEVINIFSIASGHLYERFLRIMIISVLKHTNNPIKLWILKQYLSPSFKEYIPFMAHHFNFTFELVDYKWPKWLRRQEEKQREIWGYKILFLDVLFPMYLERIIYVDADQIVRSDLLELIHLDLQNAPYAYTPFCDSRKEMDGYRFWKHGYWSNLLGKRKYHISALYVIDLKQFRKLGAGDKLRATYQALSQDPNSLANLDQDLPNSMIDSVPIFSLPQDWLWCETWCSDEDKTRAKTIDMCNNPLTKEPKLVAAKRIANEWIKYDEEAREIIYITKPMTDKREKNHRTNKHIEL